MCPTQLFPWLTATQSLRPSTQEKPTLGKRVLPRAAPLLCLPAPLWPRRQAVCLPEAPAARVASLQAWAPGCVWILGWGASITRWPLPSMRSVLAKSGPLYMPSLALHAVWLLEEALTEVETLGYCQGGMCGGYSQPSILPCANSWMRKSVLRSLLPVCEFQEAETLGAVPEVSNASGPLTLRLEACPANLAEVCTWTAVAKSMPCFHCLLPTPSMGGCSCLQVWRCCTCRGLSSVPFPAAGVCPDCPADSGKEAACR